MVPKSHQRQRQGGVIGWGVLCVRDERDQSVAVAVDGKRLDPGFWHRSMLPQLADCIKEIEFVTLIGCIEAGGLSRGLGRVIDLLRVGEQTVFKV
ncbi:hypothetical protein OG418_48120 [Streptomyces phaeochromogenes]|uniref:hypothetical protein n=1 Tax=Streptomyces phaeochromogenes TaxID=1923 RepID=UPI0032552DA9